MVGAIAIDKPDHLKTGPFLIRPSKSQDFKCFWISYGQISDPHCNRATPAPREGDKRDVLFPGSDLLGQGGVWMAMTPQIFHKRQKIVLKRANFQNQGCLALIHNLSWLN